MGGKNVETLLITWNLKEKGETIGRRHLFVPRQSIKLLITGT